jgi:hypothetical protein
MSQPLDGRKTLRKVIGTVSAGNDDRDPNPGFPEFHAAVQLAMRMRRILRLGSARSTLLAHHSSSADGARRDTIEAVRRSKNLWAVLLGFTCFWIGLGWSVIHEHFQKRLDPLGWLIDRAPYEPALSVDGVERWSGGLSWSRCNRSCPPCHPRCFSADSKAASKRSEV